MIKSGIFFSCCQYICCFTFFFFITLQSCDADGSDIQYVDDVQQAVQTIIRYYLDFKQLLEQKRTQGQDLTTNGFTKMIYTNLKEPYGEQSVFYWPPRSQKEPAVIFLPQKGLPMSQQEVGSQKRLLYKNQHWVGLIPIRSDTFPKTLHEQCQNQARLLKPLRLQRIALNIGCVESDLLVVPNAGRNLYYVVPEKADAQQCIALSAFKDLAHDIKIMHQHHIFHRDIKLENLTQKEQHIYLIDNDHLIYPENPPKTHGKILTECYLPYTLYKHIYPENKIASENLPILALMLADNYALLLSIIYATLCDIYFINDCLYAGGQCFQQRDMYDGILDFFHRTTQQNDNYRLWIQVIQQWMDTHVRKQYHNYVSHLLSNPCSYLNVHTTNTSMNNMILNASPVSHRSVYDMLIFE